MYNVHYEFTNVNFCDYRLLLNEVEPNWSEESFKSNSTFFRLFNVAVFVGLVYSIWIIFAKGMLSIGSEFKIFQDILNHERALLDNYPAPFAIIQSLLFLFYILPIVVVSMVFLFRNRKPCFLWDMALIYGGLMLQAQFSFIVTALDEHTPTRVDPLDCKFWINNIVLLATPQLLLWSLYKTNIRTAVERKRN